MSEGANGGQNGAPAAFYFCESCGKRIMQRDIDEGRARDKQLKGMHCAACAVGIMTMQMKAVTIDDVARTTNAPPARGPALIEEKVSVLKPAKPKGSGDSGLRLSKDTSRGPASKVRSRKSGALLYAGIAVVLATLATAGILLRQQTGDERRTTLPEGGAKVPESKASGTGPSGTAASTQADVAKAKVPQPAPGVKPEPVPSVKPPEPEPARSEPSATNTPAPAVEQKLDIREESAQWELDRITAMEKDGKLSPYEVRLQLEKLVASRGSTKAGKLAAERIPALPVLKLDKNLALNKPATASDTEGTQEAKLAVDGSLDLLNSWWGPAAPQWLKVDLGESASIAVIQIFPYWGADRHYQYTIDLSKDGNEWRTVVDQSANTTPSTPDGNLHILPKAEEARFVRVNMLKHSLNPSVHIVELRVFPQ